MKIHPYLNSNKKLAIAHRGGISRYPENTMEAFQEAIDLGYKYLETDIQVTSDNKLVIFHDDKLDRLTNVSGKLKERSWDEIKHTKINNKYSIPMLSELITSWPDIKINIDPKIDDCIGPLIDFLKKNDVFDRVCIGSFSQSRLDILRKELGTKLCTSAGPSEVFKIKFPFLSSPNNHIKANCIQVPVKYYGIKIINEKFVNFCHSQDLQVHAWTINDPEEMSNLLDIGVDGIISDNINELKNILVESEFW